MFRGKIRERKAQITPGYHLGSNHLEEKSEGNQEMHGEDWLRRSRTDLVEGVKEKQHKWQGKEQNGGALTLPMRKGMMMKLK